MDKFTCAELALQHFKDKRHTLEHENFAGSRIEYKTYEVEVAIFGDDFHEPPTIHSLRVRLTDEEYLLLLQWQLQHPDYGFNHYDIDTDAMITIESQVEARFFPDGSIGTYAIHLTEIKRDTAQILRGVNSGQGE